jgi:hypothetical protein
MRTPVGAGNLEELSREEVLTPVHPGILTRATHVSSEIAMGNRRTDHEREALGHCTVVVGGEVLFIKIARFSEESQQEVPFVNRPATLGSHAAGAIA